MLTVTWTHQQDVHCNLKQFMFVGSCLNTSIVKEVYYNTIKFMQWKCRELSWFSGIVLGFPIWWLWVRIKIICIFFPFYSFVFFLSVINFNWFCNWSYWNWSFLFIYLFIYCAFVLIALFISLPCYFSIHFLFGHKENKVLSPKIVHLRAFKITSF